MSKYAGIDYSGPGSTVNRDVATGIRYGVISQNSIQPDVMSDIWSEARDLSYEAAKEELENSIYRVMQNADMEDRKDGLKAALRDLYYGDRRSAELEDACDEIIDIWDEFLGDTLTEADKLAIWEVVSDRFGDSYQDNGDRSWLREKDGYELSNCLISDVFVSKSPYFTYAQHCSPCCPGALNLDNPFEGLAVPQGNHASFAEDFKWNAEAAGFPACYCLGHAFFDNEKAPYEVFSVATGKRVVMKTQWKSAAKWPDGVGINLGNTANISDDIHGDAASAQAVCDLLVKNGFGGDGKVFPVWTQVREEKVEVEQ